MKELWSFDPGIYYLNHGSYGACPREVLAFQDTIREQLESNPVDFFHRHYESLWFENLTALSSAVGAESAGMAFVPNATMGFNCVLQSLSFQANDEILLCNHEYPATINAAQSVAQRSGAVVQTVEIPLPVSGPDDIVQRFTDALTPKTRLVICDAITSATALVLPIAEITAICRQRGILTLIDGSHAPGHMPLNLLKLGANFFTGNCHKWLCTPKGSAFLYVAPEWRSRIHNCIVSHAYNSPRTDRSGFHLEFMWGGTYDPSAVLSIKFALEWLEKLLPGGIPALMRRNHDLIVAVRQKLCAALDIEPICPDSMLGSMASIPLGDAGPERELVAGRDPLEHTLARECQTYAPIFRWPTPTQRMLRVSAQAYNVPGDYTRLCEFLSTSRRRPT